VDKAVKHYADGRNMHKITIIVSISLLTLILVMVCSCKSSLSTLTTTDFNSDNSGSSKSANGLSLSFSLDAKTYKPGDTINMVISETNTLSKMNNILVSDKWPVSGLSVDLCGTESFPFGVVVMQGDYTTDDISTAIPLILYNPNVIVQCYIPPVLNVKAYDFKPSSDIATINGSTPNQTATIEMSTKISMWSYWAGSPPNAVQHNFETGVYTVVAGDEWGALVVLHFTVKK
jgi:hypothetical protein